DGSFGLLWLAMIYVSHNRRAHKLRHNVGTSLRYVSMQSAMYQRFGNTPSAKALKNYQNSE
ncbi:MAG: hypothetical protein SPE79_02270, partial [Sodaliphilus sp.]|nr:hypothetical protein [Sodaliphilus sp.]